jgi:hypothetical protein
MSNVSSILAIAFLTPGFFVAGILLASIPIIIHFLNRRRFKEQPWAAMEFLLRAMRKNRRRLRFEQWVLLATRCLVLALLGIALARPMGCSQSSLAALAGRRTGLNVIVIDNSYSMAYQADRPNAKTHLEQAKLIAKGLIDRLSSGGESVVLISVGKPATAILPKPVYDLGAAKSAIDRLEQSASGTDLSGALDLALQIAKEENRQPIKNLYLLTDCTRSAFETAEASKLAQLGRDLAAQYKITLFDLSKPGQWNQAMLDLRPATNLVRAQFTNEFLADARAYGAGPDPAIQWKLDNQTLPGGGTVKLTAEAKPIQLPLSQLKEGGFHVLTSTLATQDRLPVDDSRTRVIDVASELRVLIVEGERGLGAMSGSGAFLQLALAPPADAGVNTSAQKQSSSYVSPELISDLELSNKVFSDYRAIILAGVPSLQSGQADALQRFVQSGGTLIVFMGEAVNGDAYNSTLLPRSLIPGPLVKRVAVASDQPGVLFDFKPNSNLHPLLQIFRGEERSGLDTAQVFTYWQLSLPADSKTQRVLDYLPLPGNEKGDPAITLHDLGAGRVAFVSTSSDASWTTLPAKPAYLALVHEMLAGSVRSGDGWLNLSVGDRLEIPANIKLTVLPSMKDAAQNDVPLEPFTPQGQATQTYRSAILRTPGVYSLATGPRTFQIAVNPPADEGDVRPLDLNAVKKALGDIDFEPMKEELPAVAVATDRGRDFGWAIMMIVLSLVGLECLMAMRFGHYRK